MIRRGFWLAAGATLGVMGYRRMTRLARELGFPLDRPPASGQNGLHHDSRQVRGDDNLTGRPRHGAPARPRGGTASIAAAAVFVRDVREGMAEYRSLHRGKLARTLGSRSGPAAAGGSGASERRISGR
jgi:hypothetical protein